MLQPLSLINLFLIIPKNPFLSLMVEEKEAINTWCFFYAKGILEGHVNITA